jgi:tetratricopeptide (TPR) repeat protein
MNRLAFQRAVLPVALGLLAVLVYIPTLSHDFVYDDRALIEQNPLLKSLRSIPTLFVTDLWSGVGPSHSADGIARDQGSLHRRYRPLPMASYALNHALGESRPLGYHLVNVLLHAATSVLVYLVALELRWSPAGAILAGVLFAVHPLHTEPVAWVVGRPEMMMSLGLLGALWFHLRGRPAAAIAAFLLAMLSKEQAVVFPGLALLTDLCRNTRSECVPLAWRTLLWRYGGYALVLSLFLLARVAVLGGFQPDRYPFSENPLEHLAGSTWLLSVIKMAGHYLWLTLWPAVLSVDYSYDALPMATTAFDAGVLWSVLAWSSLLGTGLWGWRRDRRITAAVGLTALPFLPVANLLVPVGTPLAERLFYLPLGGLCLLGGVGYEAVRRATGDGKTIDVRSSWFEVLPVSKSTNRQINRFGGRLALVFVALACLALAIRTESRLRDWRNSEVLFRSAVAAFPASARAHFLLGSELLGQGTPSALIEGITELETTLTIYPDYVRSDAVFANNLGVGLIQLGRYDEGRAALEHATGLRPRWANPYHHLGFAYMKAGRAEDAVRAWRTDLALAPDDLPVRLRLGRLLAQLRRYEEGLAEAEAAIALDPGYASAHFTRGWALQGLGRLQEARASYEHVLAMPDAPGIAKTEAARKLMDLRE